MSKSITSLFALLALTVSAYAEISVVQTYTQNQGTYTMAFSGSTTAGNAIIVFTGTSATQDVTDVNDDNGNSYSEIVKNTTGARRCSIWKADSINGGIPTAVTVTTDTHVSDTYIIITEVSVDDDLQTDQIDTKDNDSADVFHEGGAITTGQNDVIVVSTIRPTTNFNVVGVEAGYTELAKNNRMAASYRVQTGSTFFTEGQFEISTIQQSGGCIASFYEGVPVAPGPSIVILKRGRGR